METQCYVAAPGDHLYKKAIEKFSFNIWERLHILEFKGSFFTFVLTLLTLSVRERFIISNPLSLGCKSRSSYINFSLTLTSDTCCTARSKDQAIHVGRMVSSDIDIVFETGDLRHSLHSSRLTIP